MTQTYKMMLGTSGKQWEQLTVKDDGTMMLYFHGTDRSVTQEVTVVTEGEWKGWLCSEKGSMFPGLASGKWNKMDDVRGLTADVVETTEPAEPEVIVETTDDTDLEPAPVYTDNAELEQLRAENQRLQEQIAQMENQPRPRRQRKPRKPRVEHQPSDIIHQTSDSKNLFAAVGMVAAATVALLVIYETGLLIPLGLIGLATGGILK